MSDRLAVMREGEIEQVGPPQSVYDEPRSAYVADFLGLANLLPAEVATAGAVDVLGRTVATDTHDVTGACTVFVRPERVGLSPVGEGTVDGTVSHVDFVGATTHVRLAVAGHELRAMLSNDGAQWVPAPGTDVGVRLPGESIRLLAR